MALIVESDSNRPEGRRVRRAGLRTPARERLWPAGNRDGCRWLLTVAILLVTCLARPIGCSRGELHVHEYAILRTDPCAGNVQPASSFGGGKSALKLSELVTQTQDTDSHTEHKGALGAGTACEMEPRLQVARAPAEPPTNLLPPSVHDHHRNSPRSVEEWNDN
uniref:Uncharacterized protein n=1 Tax=Anopheles merus TaxID=30066 RepID=A0A182V6T7_ANOME